jgi:hypothetical protein
LPKSASASSKKDHAAGLSRIEQAAQVLLGLADILADHRGEIDAVEIEPKMIGDDFGGHRLAGAAVAGEQHADAEARLIFPSNPQSW